MASGSPHPPIPWAVVAKPLSQSRVALLTTAGISMKGDPPFDLEYVTSTWLLSAAERRGARVFNAPGAIRDHNEKVAIFEFPQFVAPTLVSRDPEQLHAFIDAQLREIEEEEAGS